MKTLLKQIRNTLKKLGTRQVTSWCFAIVLSFFAISIIQHGLGEHTQLSSQSWNIVSEVFADNHTGGDTSTAQSAQDVLSRSFGVIGQGIAGIAALFIKLISGIVMFCLMMIGPLMDNTFILDGEMGEKLHTVWVIVRNFVNIFFALALVVIALMSVIGFGDEGGNYALKKFIPKMAIALIVVNFTFLAARVVLDVNNVLTTAIFSIPQSVTGISDVGPTGLSGQRIFKKFKCLDSSETAAEASRRAEQLSRQYGGTIADFAGVCFAVQPPDGATLQSLINQTDPNQQGIISLEAGAFQNRNFVWAMATQFQGLHNLNKVSTLLDPTGSGLTVNALYSVVIAVVYATAYISLFIILLARMAVLWITIMLSPLVAINIVFPDLKFGNFDVREQFLKHAFVPVKIAIPLALGYVMLSQMIFAVDPSSAVFEGIDFSQGGEFARGVSFRTLIYGAASIAVIWMGVFAAGEGVIGGEFARGFMGKIKEIGKTVARWPLYIRAIPVSGGPSLANLAYTVKDLNNRIRERARTSNIEFANRTLDELLPRAEVTSALDNIRRAATTQNRLDTSALSTFAAGAGSAVFATEMQRFLDDDDISDTVKRDLARRTGHRGDIQSLRSALRQGGESVRNIQQAISTTTTTPGGGQTPTYRDVGKVDLSSVNNWQINNQASLDAIDENLRNTYFNVSNTGDSVNLKGLDFQRLIETLRDRQKFGRPAFNEFVADDRLNQIAQNESIRQRLENDDAILDRLKSSLTDGSNAAEQALNASIIQTYMTIMGARNMDELKQRETRFEQYNEDGTVRNT